MTQLEEKKPNISGNLISKNLTRKVTRIISAGLNAVNPKKIIADSIKLHKESLIIRGETITLKEYHRIILIGFGKASQSMALGVKEILGKRLTYGIIISKSNELTLEKQLLPEIITLIGDHPIPGKNSLISSNVLLQSVKELNSDDLVICVISGGGSALFTRINDGINFTDFQVLSKKLILSGADISEINAVRSKIDTIKGGGLARLLSPARIISLILSDVVGDSVSCIASGPTSINPISTKAIEVIRNHRLVSQINPNIIKEMNKKQEFSQVSEYKYKGGNSVSNFIIGNNAMMLNEALKEVRKQGFNGEIISSRIQGDCQQIGRMFGEIIHRQVEKRNYHFKPTCLVAGGETTVVVKGKGKGGRNLETALACALAVNGLKNVLFVALASDGEDGSSEMAGALITGETIPRASKLGIDPSLLIENNDSLQFFKKVGGLIHTGPTNTNANDIYLMIAY